MTAAKFADGDGTLPPVPFPVSPFAAGGEGLPARPLAPCGTFVEGWGACPPTPLPLHGSFASESPTLLAGPIGPPPPWGGPVTPLAQGRCAPPLRSGGSEPWSNRPWAGPLVDAAAIALMLAGFLAGWEYLARHGHLAYAAVAAVCGGVGYMAATRDVERCQPEESVPLRLVALGGPGSGRFPADCSAQPVCGRPGHPTPEREATRRPAWSADAGSHPMNGERRS